MSAVVSMTRIAVRVSLLVASLVLSLDAQNTESFYNPIHRDIEGWTVSLDPSLLTEAHANVSQQALAALANHLQRIKFIVRPDQLTQLQKLPIWVDRQHELGNMQYHPDRGWLVANGYDPRLVQHVHIPRAQQLLDRDQWAKHPYVVLHELAHAYHDQVLSFDEPRIIDAFERAKAGGKYEQVLLFTGDQVRHYGMTNHKEYFAEATEAYLGVNDFYPFVRAELRRHDPRMFQLMEATWGKLD